MAVNMFIKGEGLVGESIHSDHVGEINVLAWSWGLSNSGSAQVYNQPGRPHFQNLGVTKWIDKSSTALMEACASGRKFKELTLIVVRPSAEGAKRYLKLIFKNAMVSSVSLGGSGGEDRLTENVSFDFAEFHYEYQPSDREGAYDGDPHALGWDMIENKKV